MFKLGKNAIHICIGNGTMLEAFKNTYLIWVEVCHTIFAKQFEWEFIDDCY